MFFIKIYIYAILFIMVKDPASTNTKKHNEPLLILVVFVFLWVLYYFFYPTYQQFFPACTFHQITGFYCPGCGAQRAFLSLLHGNFLLALQQNFIVVISIPFVVYLYILVCINYFQKRQIGSIVYKKQFILFFVFTLLLFGVLRNIPVYPFTNFCPG
ncbi:DUF2752 domain-containing protein [Limnovirga soli]|uniref:DUF2752 domain-containing protein n=1 Tax=Limnovirga soli TaxID=2656915 RepID=A0A8J8FE17_9BACT|nr:DUF2752 domain-containing protein [Limnovirga soli]